MMWLNVPSCRDCCIKLFGLWSPHNGGQRLVHINLLLTRFHNYQHLIKPVWLSVSCWIKKVQNIDNIVMSFTAQLENTSSADGTNAGNSTADQKFVCKFFHASPLEGICLKTESVLIYNYQFFFLKQWKFLLLVRPFPFLLPPNFKTYTTNKKFHTYIQVLRGLYCIAASSSSSYSTLGGAVGRCI